MITVLLLNGLLPATVYYIGRFGTSISRTTLINIVEITTTFTVIHWPWRLRQLLRRGGERAPLNCSKWTLDTFQWNFLFGIFLVTFFCIMAAIEESMRWYMLGPVTLFGLVAAQMVLTYVLARAEVRIPIRFSSLPAGTPCRPAVYSLIEDITAVDGAAGAPFRDRLNVRYELSALFRKLLLDVTLVLGTGFLIQTGLQILIIFVTKEEVFVGASTALLWGWCGLSACWAIPFTRKRLEQERMVWGTVNMSMRTEA